MTLMKNSRSVCTYCTTGICYVGNDIRDKQLEFEDVVVVVDSYVYKTNKVV